MIEDKDYIMRLTHEVVRTLIRLLFQKDIDKDEEAGVSAEMAVRYRELLAMIKDGQVNEAEIFCWMRWIRTTRLILNWGFYFMRSWERRQRNSWKAIIIRRMK